jgi:hypothetical protein
MKTPHYQLIRRGKWGRLLATHVYFTPIKGYSAFIDDVKIKCRLFDNGMLEVYADTEWDFASGPTVNTPAMVTASLAHDMFCHFTDRGLLPWEVRHKADKYFGSLLKEAGAKWSRFWRVPAVVMYSQTIARLKRTKYED